MFPIITSLSFITTFEGAELQPVITSRYLPYNYYIIKQEGLMSAKQL